MKKLPTNLDQEFQKLKHIQLSADNKSDIKRQVLSGIHMNQVKQPTLVETLSLIFKSSLRQLSAKPVGMMILAIGVIIGPGIATVSAARSSLPGDRLYSLKRSLENVELSLALSENKKTEKKIDQVATRLTELHRITQEQTPSPEREQKIVLALEELKKDTEDVKSRLETAKNEPQNTDEEVVALAKIIEEKTSDYKETLKTSKTQLSAVVADDVEDLENALSTVQEVAIDALTIIVEDHEDAEGEEPAVTTEDLQEKVEQQLVTLKEQVEGVQQRLTATKDHEALLAAQNEEKEAAELDTSDEEANESAETSTESDSVEENEEAQDEEENNVVSDLESKLSGIIDDQIVYIDELLAIQEFRAALDQLLQTKNEVDALSSELKEYRLSLPELDIPEPIEEEPQEEPQQDTGDEQDQESTETEESIDNEVLDEPAGENKEESDQNSEEAVEE